MSVYVEITSLPLKRNCEQILAPAALLAARLENPDETIELRIQVENGTIHCYVGVDNILKGKQIKTILSELGCCYTLLDHHFFKHEGAVLIRRASENYRSIPNQNIERSLIINEISTTPEKTKSLYYALSSMNNGCGYSIYIKRLPQLDRVTTTYLKNNALKYDANTNLFYKLYNATHLFQSCLCVYGNNKEERDWLKSELKYTFTELADAGEIPVNTKQDSIWEYLEKYNSGLIPQAKRIVFTFLYSEIQNLSSLDGLNSTIRGLHINHDSLFEKQKHALTVGNEYISLGYNKDMEEQKLPLNTLKQHMFIAGAPGTGKGNLIFHIALQLFSLKVPLLLIESAKQEQHHLRTDIPQLRVWRPRGGEYLLNPFSLPPHITLEDYKSSLIQMLRTCFKGGGTESALDELYTTTLNNCLSKSGYTETSTNASAGIVPFGLAEFIKEYIHLLETNGYSDRVRNDMRTAGISRLRNLLDQNPDVFDSVNSVPVSELANGYNLLQLNTLTTVESKQLFSTILLISLGAWLRLNGKATNKIQLVVILDESHNLLKGVNNSTGTEYTFAEDFQNLLLEMRSLGVCFIISDQSATNLPKLISEVCATKVFLGASQFSGIEMFAKYLNADEITLNNLYILSAGEGIWHTSGMSSGAFFKTPNIIDNYDINSNYPAKNTYIESNKKFFCQSFNECLKCPSNAICDIHIKQKARRVSNTVLMDYKQVLEDSLKKLKKAFISGDINTAFKEEQKNFTNIIYNISHNINDTPDNGSPYCCAVQFFRHYNRESSFPMDSPYLDCLFHYLSEQNPK